MDTVLVHEWLTNRAGSEKVVAALRRTFPGAPVVTTMCWPEAFPDWTPIVTSPLQRAARGPQSHVRVLPLMPAAFQAVRLPPAELVVTSFHTFALWARVPRDTPHLVYCHTPPRFIWGPSQFDERSRWSRRLAAVTGTALRRADRARAGRPTRLVANSMTVASRIRAAYGREATVVHPPVAVERFAARAHGRREDYFLVLSRLVPAKRVELAIAAFTELSWPLVVAGTGRNRPALEASAPANVRFVGHVPDEDLPDLMAGARALICPSEEDFGIALVEAMAAGTPVVALARGGAVETVHPDESGVLFAEETAKGLADAVRRAAARDWDPDQVSATTRRYSEARFDAEIRAVVAELTA